MMADCVRLMTDRKIKKILSGMWELPAALLVTIEVGGSLQIIASVKGIDLGDWPYRRRLAGDRM